MWPWSWMLLLEKRDGLGAFGFFGGCRGSSCRARVDHDLEAINSIPKLWPAHFEARSVGPWLGGEQLNVQDFCQQEYSKMISLDREIFGDLPEFH